MRGGAWGVAACALAVGLAGCGGFSLIAAPPLEVTWALAEGEGADRDEALEAALQELVRSVVGVYVESDTLVRQAELVRHEIWSHSRGYVERFQVLEDRQTSGRRHVTVFGAVRREPLRQRLTSIGLLPVSGETEAANARLTQARYLAASETARRAFGSACLNGWEAEVGAFRHDVLGGEDVRVRVQVHVNARRDVLRRWMEALGRLREPPPEPSDEDMGPLGRLIVQEAFLESEERIPGRPPVLVQRWGASQMAEYPAWLPRQALAAIEAEAAWLSWHVSVLDAAGRVIGEGRWRAAERGEAWQEHSLLMVQKSRTELRVTLGGFWRALSFEIAGNCRIADLKRIHRVEVRLEPSPEGAPLGLPGVLTFPIGLR